MVELRENFRKSKLNLENEELSIDMKQITTRVLQNIKREYETFVQVFEDAEKMHNLLCKQIGLVMTEDYTRRNIKDYENSLKEKLQLLKSDNDKLTNKIENVKKMVYEIKQKQQAVLEAKKYKHLKGIGSTGLHQMKICTLLGLTPQQWSDTHCLKNKIDSTICEIQTTQKDLQCRFFTRSNYKSLLRKTLRKESECEALGLINTTLKLHVKRLKLAIEAAQILAYHESPRSYQSSISIVRVVQSVIDDFDKTNLKMQFISTAPAWSTHNNEKLLLDQFVGESRCEERGKEASIEIEVDQSLKRKLEHIVRPLSFEETNSFIDDDPIKEQEAELTMDYIEQFNLGILRTPETLKCFKQVVEEGDTEESHLLHYCKLLISTIDLIGKQPSQWETVECFKCAISNGELDLVEYWISQELTDPSEVVGYFLLNSCSCNIRKCNCKEVMLAEEIFKKLCSHHLVINCILRQGRYSTALLYAVEAGKFSDVDFARMLEDETTSQELSSLMANIHNIPIEKIVITLEMFGHTEKAIQLMKKCQMSSRHMNFDYRQFSSWEGSHESLENFGNLCLKKDLHEVPYDFISSAILHGVLKNSAATLKVICH